MVMVRNGVGLRIRIRREIRERVKLESRESFGLRIEGVRGID